MKTLKKAGTDFNWCPLLEELTVNNSRNVHIRYT